MTFILRISYFRIISEFFLNSRESVHVFYKVYCDSLLARILNSRSNQLANISEKKVHSYLQCMDNRNSHDLEHLTKK